MNTTTRAVLSLVIAVGIVPLAKAEPRSLRDGMSALSEQVRTLVRGNNLDEVWVGEFKPVGADAGRPKLRPILASELVRAGVKLSSKARFVVRGEYTCGPRDSAGGSPLQVKCEVVDTQDDSATRIPVACVESPTLAATLDETRRAPGGRNTTVPYCCNPRTTITIGQVTGPPQLAGNPGKGIEVLLEDYLRKAGIRVSLTASFAIRGTYGQTSDGDLASIRITLEIVDGTNRPIQVDGAPARFAGDFAPVRDSRKPTPMPAERHPESKRPTADRDGTEQLGVLLGATQHLSPSEPTAERHKQLCGTKSTPVIGPDGEWASAYEGSPYRVAVLVNGEARKLSRREGLIFVELREQEEYTVRVTNSSDYDAAVGTHIDGLSLFRFGQNPEYRYIMLPKKVEGVVKGWYLTNTLAKAFLVTGYPDSTAAKANPEKAKGDGDKATTKFGIITVTFAAAWTGGIDNAPPDERLVRYMANRGDPLGTAVGRDLTTNLEETSRVVGVTRDIVSIRYERPQE